MYIYIYIYIFINIYMNIIMLDNSYEYHAVSNAWSCVHNHAALCRDVTTVRGMARRRDDCARHGSAT